MRTSSQTPRVYALHEAPLPQTAWVDSNGETWVPAGHTSSGELILACPEPTQEVDRGEGSSFPWTLAQVERAFGPLTAQTDMQQRVLAEVDQEFLDYYGPDQRAWKSWQVETYETAMAQAFAGFASQNLGAAA